MAKTIQVTYDPENICLNIEQDETEVKAGELVEWVFHGLPEKFSPYINFKITHDDNNDIFRYYGPFSAITQEIPGAHGGQTRVWGIVTSPFLKTYKYRAVIMTGVGEDPFDQPYGNSPESVPKAIMVSTEARLRHDSGIAIREEVTDNMRTILKMAAGVGPIAALRGEARVIPITETTNDQGEKELVIHDDFLWVTRSTNDLVIWDFSLVPHHPGWFPLVDFIGGQGMAYEDIKNMHFGSFNSITVTVGRVIGMGHGKVPGAYHYRVAMANAQNGSLAFKSSPDPVVDYPEPGGDTGG